MQILALNGSPRKNGNSEILLDFFLNTLNSLANFPLSIYKYRIYELKILPCLACGECEKTKKCKLKDDFSLFYELLPQIDFLILSTPIYFYNHPSLVQAFFERFQYFWVKKNIFKETIRQTPLKAILFCVGATTGEKLFSATKRTFKYVLNTVEGKLIAEIFVRKVDQKGEILTKKEVFLQVKKLAMQILEPYIS